MNVKYVGGLVYCLTGGATEPFVILCSTFFVFVITMRCLLGECDSHDRLLSFGHSQKQTAG